MATAFPTKAFERGLIKKAKRHGRRAKRKGGFKKRKLQDKQRIGLFGNSRKGGRDLQYRFLSTKKSRRKLKIGTSEVVMQRKFQGFMMSLPDKDLLLSKASWDQRDFMKLNKLKEAAWSRFQPYADWESDRIESGRGYIEFPYGKTQKRMDDHAFVFIVNPIILENTMAKIVRRAIRTGNAVKDSFKANK